MRGLLNPFIVGAALTEFYTVHIALHRPRETFHKKDDILLQSRVPQRLLGGRVIVLRSILFTSLLPFAKPLDTS